MYDSVVIDLGDNGIQKLYFGEVYRHIYGWQFIFMVACKQS